MTEKERLKELTNMINMNVEEIKEIHRKGIEARQTNNRFEAKAGEGYFYTPSDGEKKDD